MKGAIAGDIIGSFREIFHTKNKDFTIHSRLCYFTDDTVLTVAVADALMGQRDFGKLIRRYARRRPFRGYGPRFQRWMVSPNPRPYNSLGNGSAMRVSPVAYASEDENEVLQLAKASAECTHNHPDGIRGAQAVALGVFLARNGHSKAEIRTEIHDRFDYNLDRTIDEIRPKYRFNMTCPGSVPEAIVAFLDSENFEDAIRNAISLGGDADTQAAIAGAFAEAFYGDLPDEIERLVMKRLPNDYKKVVYNFLPG